MSNTIRTKSEGVLLGKGWKYNFVLLLWACLMAPFILIQGCTQGIYGGKKLNPPVKKVVLFGIEGTDGEEFTKMLGTELTNLGRTVVYGDQFGKPSDLMAAAKIARDNQAGAFITGQITRNEIVDYSKYTVSGTFTLHEVEAGDQIGGITNAAYTEDIDPLLGVAKTFYGALDILDKKKQEEIKMMEEKKKETKVKSPQLRRKLAGHVSRELSKGLGLTWRPN